jgi:dihydrolipoamide dehydrogenase
MHSPLVVLGGGPGGYAAAFLAADRGMEVTLVDSEPRLGGTCLLRGCVPSKALLHVARVIAESRELGQGWGIQFDAPQINLQALRERKAKLVDTLSSGLGQLAKRRKVRVIHARGWLENSTTLKLEQSGAPETAEDQLTFDHLILSTGSIPASPTALSLASPRVLNSTTALDLPEIPASLLVIGGGYIGLELGTVYAQLGSQVSVVELTNGLLPGADRDLVKPLHRRLTSLFGDRIHLSTQVISLQDDGDCIQVEFERSVDNEPSHRSTERYSHVLVAVGRRPASERLGLENTAVRVNSGGFVVTDNSQRTNDPHIFAIGDVAGEPMLAHKATHQAKVAVDVIGGEPAEFSHRTIPAVVFTDPEVAWAGLTELQAKATGQRYQTAVYPWAASGRAHALGRPEGITKWLVDPDSGCLLGCGIVGSGAGELIGEAVLAIDKRCTSTDVADAIHPHPTLSETLMNAAEVQLGSAIEIYKPKRNR